MTNPEMRPGLHLKKNQKEDKEINSKAKIFVFRADRETIKINIFGHCDITNKICKYLIGMPTFCVPSTGYLNLFLSFWNKNYKRIAL